MKVRALLLAGLTAVLAGPVTAQDRADTVLLNGEILTVDDDFSVVEALAIAGERILATGSNDAVEALAGPETTVLDLGGATVIPGLIDNHFHFTRAMQRWHRQVRLDGVNSRRRALEMLAEKAAGTPAGEWIMVQGGWSAAQFADEPGGFSLAELDDVAPENPLFLQQRYSTIYANTLALRAVGLSPADGARRDAEGLATFQPPYGAFIERMEPTSRAQLERNLEDLMQALNGAGLTGLYSLGRGPEGEAEVLEERARTDRMPMRIWQTLTYEADDEASANAAVELIRANEPNTFDGEFGLLGLGEHIYLPFFDFPSRTESWPDDVMAGVIKIARAAAAGGWHIHEHTMSNVSVGDLLDRFEPLDEEIPIQDLRWTLAHVYDISPENIERAKALGMTLAVHGVAMHSATPMPLRAIQDSGIVWGLGTDATVVSHYQPFVTLGWVVSGNDLAGNPVLEQTVSRRQALIAHTRANAYMFFQEDEVGSLEPGKLADLVVLDRDYLSVPADEIMAIQPVLTMVGGRIVFEHETRSPLRRGR